MSTVCPVHLSTSPFVSWRICTPVLLTMELRARESGWKVLGRKMCQGHKHMHTDAKSNMTTLIGLLRFSLVLAHTTQVIRLIPQPQFLPTLNQLQAPLCIFLEILYRFER